MRHLDKQGGGGERWRESKARQTIFPLPPFFLDFFPLFSLSPSLPPVVISFLHYFLHKLLISAFLNQTCSHIGLKHCSWTRPCCFWRLSVIFDSLALESFDLYSLSALACSFESQWEKNNKLINSRVLSSWNKMHPGDYPENTPCNKRKYAPQLVFMNYSSAVVSPIWNQGWKNLLRLFFTNLPAMQNTRFRLVKTPH